MVKIKAKKRYIEEIERLLNQSELNYTKINDKTYEIDSNLFVVNDLLQGYIKLSDKQKEELYKNDNNGINSYVDKLTDEYNPDMNIEQYRVEDIDEEGNPIECAVEEYEDYEEIFL